MPKITESLTIPKVRALATGPDGVYAVSPRLYMQVQGGACSMLYRYRSPVTGKGRVMGLGSFTPESINAADTLDALRLRVGGLNLDVANKIDPLEVKQVAAVRRVASATTLGTVFDEWTALNAGQWSPRYAQAQKNYRSMVPVEVAGMPVADVSPDDVAAVLAPYWATKAVTAKRLRTALETVFARAIAKGYTTGANPAALAVQKHLLPKVKHKVTPHRMTEVAAMPALYAALAARTARGKRLVRTSALQFCILTLARSANVRLATWSEIDETAGTWTIDGSKMKNGETWVCPLSSAALKLLASMPRTSEFVFPGCRLDKAMATDRLDREMKSVGSAANVHGIRASARTWMQATGQDFSAAEMQLAHNVHTTTQAAYARSDMLAIRAKLAEDWGQYVAPAPVADNVVSMAEARRA